MWRGRVDRKGAEKCFFFENWSLFCEGLTKKEMVLIVFCVNITFRSPSWFFLGLEIKNKKLKLYLELKDQECP